MSGIVSWKYFSCARIRPKGKRYAEPDKIILNRTKTIIDNTILPNVEMEGRKLADFESTGRRFSLSQISSDAKLIITCMLISGWSICCVALEKQNKRKQAQGAKWITKALANALANTLAKTDQLVGLIFINAWPTPLMVRLSLSGTVHVHHSPFTVNKSVAHCY